MFQWLTDRLVLCPSTDPIEAEQMQPRYFELQGERLEVWERHVAPAEGAADRPWVILKFPGTGGRAERSSPHPAEAWPHRESVVWTVNPPGYGGSGGKASLRHTAAMAETVFDAAREAYPDWPLLLVGNSLGNLAVLYLAARCPVAGALMRNPPPLKEVIVGRHPPWRTAFVSHLVASFVPRELCAIENARRASAPAVFISAEHDRVVPLSYQQQIQEAYQGPKRVVLAEEVDHGDPLPDHQLDEYLEALRWLERSCKLTANG